MSYQSPSPAILEHYFTATFTLIDIKKMSNGDKRERDMVRTVVSGPSAEKVMEQVAQIMEVHRKNMTSTTVNAAVDQRGPTGGRD